MPKAPPPPDPVVRTLRAQLGAHERHGNAAAAADIRRVLEVHQLEKHIREVVDAAPPLSLEHAARLRALLPPAKAVADGS